MKIAFAGTPEFARVALQALGQAGHEIVLVLTQPDRPAGRGLKLAQAPVKQWALAQSYALAQPRSLRLDGKYPQDAEAAHTALQAAAPEVMVVAAYGLLLPPWVLALPRLGCLNIHASLLPRWRGAAPIQRAIEAGDTHTGITIMQMDAGLDSGDILLAEATPIATDDTSASLHERLAHLGARLCVQALQAASAGTLHARAQDSTQACYAAKISTTEARVDWSQSAETIVRRIRAFNPAPGAHTQLADQLLKLWHAEPALAPTQTPTQTPALSGGGTGVAAGTVLALDSGGITVACGAGTALRLMQVQRAGGKRLAALEFARGAALAPGARLH